MFWKEFIFNFAHLRGYALDSIFFTGVDFSFNLWPHALAVFKSLQNPALLEIRPGASKGETHHRSDSKPMCNPSTQSQMAPRGTYFRSEFCVYFHTYSNHLTPSPTFNLSSRTHVPTRSCGQPQRHFSHAWNIRYLISFHSVQALGVYPMQRPGPIVAIYEVPSPTNTGTTAQIILFSAHVGLYTAT